MGMPVTIAVRCHDADAAARGIADVAASLHDVDARFSPYKDDSELSRWQRGEVSDDDRSEDLSYLLSTCERAKAITGGYFDHRRPTTDQRTVLDPTGLTKGWAVQRAATALAQVPGAEFCVNAGGDMVMGCAPDAGDGRPWRVGIENPYLDGVISQVVEVPASGGALATSGTSARGTHIYNPLTGDYSEALGSVTVIGPDLMWADVWATALLAARGAIDERLTAWDPQYSLIRL